MNGYEYLDFVKQLEKERKSFVFNRLKRNTFDERRMKKEIF